MVAEDGSFQSQPLSVQLIDYDGSSPYAGEIVTLAVESAPKGNKGGGLTPSSAITGADGIASVNFTPGSSAGTYSVVATTRSAPDKPQTFSSTISMAHAS